MEAFLVNKNIESGFNTLELNYKDVFSYIYTNDEDCFVRVLSKLSGKSKVYNIKSLREQYRAIQIVKRFGKSNLRARLCFLYRNFYLIKEKYQNGALTKEGFKNAEKEMLRFNNNFNEPFINHVIEASTRNVNRTQYLYKNETLVTFLELTWELCEELGLESVYKTKNKEQIDKDYYKRNSKTKIKKAKSRYKEKLKTNGKLSKKEEI